MSRSLLIAIIIAVAVGGWILSGQIGLFAADAPQPAPHSREAAPQHQPVAVRVRTLAAVPYRLEVVARGRTEARRRVEVKSEIDARVIAIAVEKGAMVKAGDVLVRMAMEDRAAWLAETQALVRQRQIEFDAAKALNERGHRPEIKLAEAAALLDAARARAKQMEVDIEKLTIRAPFDGVVESRPAEIGAYLKSASPVATIADVDPFLVVAQVSEQDVGKLNVGDQGTARLVTGQEAAGWIRFISPVADAATRTFRVELEVPNPQGRIRDGITSEMRVASQSLQAHFVSPAVLTLNDSGDIGVKAVDDQGIVRFHPARIVGDAADGVWLAGLPETMRIITIGQEYVRDGDRARPVPADGEAS